MKPVLADLLAMLRLERIEQHLFRGQSQDLGWGAVFGGQVLGQALSAAEQTVPADRFPHSLHAYFLRRGDASQPIVYEVDPIRDGHSFTTRRVVAVQGGKAIFNLSASFHVEEPGFTHQARMPIVAGPEGLKSIRELSIERAAKLPPGLAAMATGDRPIEIRPITRHNPLDPEAGPPQRLLWYRAIDRLPDDPRLHAYLLAYASDSHFIGTALEPHAVSYLTPGMQVASLDHAMWFHRPFRLDEWLLYVVDSPSASGSCGLVRGQFFRRDGTLVASTAQEGLMRQRAPAAR